MRRLAHAAAFSIVIAASGMLVMWPVVADVPGRPYVLAFLDQLAHGFVVVLMVVLIIAACEAQLRPGPVRMVVQALALSIGVPATAFAVTWVASWRSFIASAGVGTDGLVADFLWIGFASAVLFSWYYAVRERAASAIDALAEESVLRHAASRRTGEARLRTLRAQVDPALLDAKLAAIDFAYRAGGGEGDRMLDELIDYLTLALRDSRGAPSPPNQGGNDVGFPGHPA